MSRWPAVVVSVDRPARQCVVSIPGITEGAGGLVAEIEQNLGDRSEDTEIRIKAGDRVWVDFLAGDPRYPIITGFRARNASNMVGTRLWEHDNFIIAADKTITLLAGEQIRLEVGGSSITITAEQIAMLAAHIGLND